MALATSRQQFLVGSFGIRKNSHRPTGGKTESKTRNFRASAWVDLAKELAKRIMKVPLEEVPLESEGGIQRLGVFQTRGPVRKMIAASGTEQTVGGEFLAPGKVRLIGSWRLASRLVAKGNHGEM